MSNSDSLLSPGQSIRPPSTVEVARTLVKKLYGMTATNIVELNGYDDRNYHFTCAEEHTNPYISSIHKHGYVLKIVNSLDSKKTNVIEAQHEMLLYLKEHGISCPQPVKNLSGTYHHVEQLEGKNAVKSAHAVRLLTYCPGELLHRVQMNNELLRNVGRFAAKIDKVLRNFTHKAYDEHRTLWVVDSLPQLRKFTFAVTNLLDRELVHEVIEAFERDVLVVVPRLEQGIIHGDFNEQNLVVNADATDIAAVIDFGDAQKSCLVFELAILLCYVILHTGDIGTGKYIIEGYESIRKLKPLEKQVLKISVCSRLCQSLVMGAYSHLHDQQNDYLLITQKSGWALLKKLWPMTQNDVLQAWGLLDS